MVATTMKMPGLQRAFPPRRPLAMFNGRARVPGPRNATTDSVKAKLMPGEAVLPTDTVQAVGGAPAIAATIAATHTPRAMADGGMADDSGGAAPLNAATAMPVYADGTPAVPRRRPLARYAGGTPDVGGADDWTQPSGASGSWDNLPPQPGGRPLAGPTPTYPNLGGVAARVSRAFTSTPEEFKTEFMAPAGASAAIEKAATTPAAAAPLAPKWLPESGQELPAGTAAPATPATPQPPVTVQVPNASGPANAQPGALPPEGSDANPGPYHQQYLTMLAKGRADAQSADQAILAGDRSRAEVTSGIQNRLDLANAEQAARASGGRYGDSTDRRLQLAKVAALRPLATAVPSFAGAPQRNYIGEQGEQQRTSDAALAAGQALKTGVQTAPLAVAGAQLGVQRTGQEVQMGQYQVQLQRHMADLAGQAAQGGEAGQQATDTLALWQKAMKGEGGPLTPHEQAQLYLNYASRALLPGMDAGAVQNMIPPQVFMSMVSGRGGAANAPGATMEGQAVRGKAGTPYEGKTGRIVNGQFVPD